MKLHDQMVLTPHPGEAADMLKVSTQEIQNQESKTNNPKQ